MQPPARRCLPPLCEGLVAYVALHLTNALAEGMNLKIRAITRRGFGVPDPDNLIVRIFLTCGGLKLRPPYNVPKRFH